MKQAIDRLLKPVWTQLGGPRREQIGIRRTMGWARRYNGWLYGSLLRERTRLCEDLLEELLEENGPCKQAANVMSDGFALDESGSLPHLEELLDQSALLIAERGRKQKTTDSYRAFFRNLVSPEDLNRWPAMLDFVTSSDVLTTVCAYLGFVPVLSRSLPPGVRIVESWKKYDGLADKGPATASFSTSTRTVIPSSTLLSLLKTSPKRRGRSSICPSQCPRKRRGN